MVAFAFSPSKLSRIKIMALVFMSIYLLAILQDFLFSRINLTGFYLSESGLFNIYWLLFIPGVWYSFRCKLPFYFCVITSLVHSVFFAGLFTTVSHIVYNNPHRFGHILSNVLSNHLYLAILAYAILPLLLRRGSTKEVVDYNHSLTVKSNGITTRIPTSDIQFIESDKPYVAIHTNGGKQLDSRSIKSLTTVLDPKIFLQVNRSLLVNRNVVEKLVSRKNGDNDGYLTNGESFRLSRHYRSKWKDLLQ